MRRWSTTSAAEHQGRAKRTGRPWHSAALVGGVLGLVAGQIAIAGFTGWLVASALGPRAPGRRARAVAIALAGVAIGLLGLWLIARAQGGVMDPVTYLAQVWGLLVPVELAVAAIAAAITAR
jgi:hypothetical protein